MLTFDKYKGHSRNITLLRTLKMIAHYSLYGLFLQAFFLNLLFASPIDGQDLIDVKISLSAQNVSLGKCTSEN